ncbi:hypothetical protein HMI56_000736 [Coelomomyces lativittatus]|nr:hypothetical protein HMI56_000736 [Coelomomyces lativittatus]
MWYTSVFAIPEGLESQERKKAFMNEESKVNFRSAVIPLQQDSPTSQKGLTHYHTFLTPKQSPSYIDISGFKNAMYQLHNDLNLLDSQADNLETSVSVGSLERFQVVGTEIIFELEYSAMELNHVASRLSKHAKALSRLSSRLRNIHTGISYPSGGGGGGSSNRHIPNAEPIHEPLPHHFTEQHERRDGTQPPQNYLRHLENSPSSPSTPGNQREELHIESINQRPQYVFFFFSFKSIFHIYIHRNEYILKKLDVFLYARKRQSF